MSEVMKIINIEEIKPHSDVNSRSVGIEEGLEDIEESMKRDGFWPTEAIWVRPTNEEGYKYEIVEGQRRLSAAKNIGLTEIPALIVE
ncbi:MAG: Nucleoid occlusion protein [Candidatus Methanolliviera sp. GoM_oil]|nr:MAG: Nucleoid occlusion protein [Candidatus Methanolliviera sp. GoM_oil]